MGAGLVADLTGNSDIGGMLFAAGAITQIGSAIKGAFPAATLGTVATKIKDVGVSLKNIIPAVVPFAGAIGSLVTALAGATITIAGISIAIGPLILAIAAISGLVFLLVNAFGKGNPVKPGSQADQYLRGYTTDNRQYSSDYVVGGNYVLKQRVEEIKKETSQVNILRKTELQLHQERLDYLATERAFRAQENADEDAALRAQKEQEEQMQLLINQQKQEASAAAAKAKAQEKYNRLLQQAQRRLSDGSDLLQELAQGALENMLNPDVDRINPFTGLAEEGLQLEDVVKTAEMMQFTQFENAQGITRSFEEYRDILNAISPITERDVYNGKISLQAVTSRMKIEKERRRELELIKKNQEAEYDLSLASLRMYDESIDPLERAVSMRRAQTQYENDIRDIRMSGLDLVVDEADASVKMVAAQARIQKKLQDIQKGQDLILNEMARRFEEYNNQVADIMANPKYSEAERRGKLQAALDSLVADLENDFGITQAQLQSQYDRMNEQMKLARNATAANFGEFMRELANPTIPPITWGGKLRDAFTSGVFAPLIKYLNEQYAIIAALIAKINRLAASGGTTTPPPGGTDDGSDGTTVADVAANRSANLSARLGKAPANFWQRFGGDSTAEKQESMRRWIESIQERIGSIGSAKTVAAARSIANSIASALSAKGLASGGLASGGNPYLVGENGPELFLPSKTGLVLNNSVSSRLIGMLSGGASSQPGSVNITINNPTIRNDADIRKLADQITRAQVSIYRTQGGRLS
jgi:hypothetical protein